MNVRFTGRHVGIADRDREYAEGKIAHLGRYHRGILDVEIRVMMDGTILEKVELQADLGHARSVAAAESRTFRPAFDKAVEILKRQLLRDKERAVGKRRRSGGRSASEAARGSGEAARGSSEAARGSGEAARGSSEAARGSDGPARDRKPRKGASPKGTET